MAQQRNDAPNFWGLLREFGIPNFVGQGVDRHQDHWDMSAFPFGPGPHNDHRHGPAPGLWAQAPGGWGGFFDPSGAWSPWEEPVHHPHHHGGRRNHEDHARERGHGFGRHGRHGNGDEDKTHPDGEHEQEQEGWQTPDTDMEEFNEKDQSPETMQQADGDNSDPEEVVLEDDDGIDTNNDTNEGQYHHGRGHRRGRNGCFRHGGLGGPRGGYGHHRRGGPHLGRGGRHGHFHGRIPHRGPGPRRGGSSQGPFPFPFGPAPPHYHDHRPGHGHPWAGVMHGFVNHPLFQAFCDQFRNNNNGNRNNADSERGTNDRSVEDDVFVPPVDIFNKPVHYVLHIALPGAKKDDVAVNWSPEHSTLQVSGIVHRPGDEELISALASSERKVGMFQRDIKLPPPGLEKEESGEVDTDGISAKMEDGVLMVMVPKVEREWTEVKRVDID